MLQLWRKCRRMLAVVSVACVVCMGAEAADRTESWTFSTTNVAVEGNIGIRGPVGAVGPQGPPGRAVSCEEAGFVSAGD